MVFFNPGSRQIEKLIRGEASRFKIKLFNVALNWSHVHLLIRIPNRKSYVGFVRSLNSKLVRLLSSVLKKNMTKIFTLRPYTKILTWGKQFEIVIDYHFLNQQEARGLVIRNKGPAKGSVEIADKKAINGKKSYSQS